MENPLHTFRETNLGSSVLLISLYDSCLQAVLLSLKLLLTHCLLFLLFQIFYGSQ